MKIIQSRVLSLVFIVSGIYLGVYLSGIHPEWQMKVKVKEVEAKNTDNAYDLQALSILNRTVMYVEDAYVDPKRVNYRKTRFFPLLKR